MTQINDGGPAFPMFKSVLSNGTTTNTAANGGMSLRDYFAGQAIMGFLANTTRPTTIAPDDATWAYCIADAMLAARGATS